jgi:hypothetical protein
MQFFSNFVANCRRCVCKVTMLKADRPSTQPIGGVLPGPGRSRSLMRAAEQLAICDLQARIAALDHAYCVQLAESEALLLVEVDATICARRASSASTTPNAIELLHAPLDALAGRVHSLLVKQGSDQAETFKRSLAGLASDLTAVHGQELRRMRESLHHAKCVAESEHERIRHAMKTQELQMKDDLRRDCDTRIAEAQAKQRKAEAATAAAVERPQVLDAQALLAEVAARHMQVEVLTAKLTEAKQKAEDMISIHREAQFDAERRAASDRLTVKKRAEMLSELSEELHVATTTGRRQSQELYTTHSAIRKVHEQIEATTAQMMAEAAEWAAAEHSHRRRPV